MIFVMYAYEGALLNDCYELFNTLSISSCDIQFVIVDIQNLALLYLQQV